MDWPRDYRTAAKMASQGRYSAAEAAQRREEELRKAHAAVARSRLEEEQAVQWLAFNRAARRYAAQHQADNRARRDAQFARLECRKEELRLAHAEELAALVKREELLLSRQPVTHSQSYIETKREERQLAEQGRYGAAHALQRKATHLASLECTLAADENHRRLQEKMQKWEQNFDGKEGIALRSLHAKTLVDEARYRRQWEATRARLTRMQADMKAAHERQCRELDTIGRVRGADGGLLQCKATRGTQLEHRILAAEHTVPSLCDMYGHLLDSSP